MKSFLNMRPFQLVLLLIFGFLAFLGLFLFATYSNVGSGPKVGAVVIWGTLPSAGVTAELQSVQSAHKEYQKVTYVQKPAATFDADLADAIASGTGPDLIIISQEQLLSDQNKISLISFSSIPQRTYLNTYLPEDELYLSSSGTYGVPYVLDPLVLYYNRTILTSNGVATVPTTWEGITGLAAIITRINSDQTIGLSTIPLGTYENIANARAILSMLFLQSGEPITQDTATGVRAVLAANSGQSSATPGESVLNFYTQFSDPSRTVYTWNASVDSARQEFIAGNTAFYIGFASELPGLKAANPNLDLDMAQIPQPQTAAVKSDYGLAYAFAIPKASKNPSGALAAAKMLADKNFVGQGATALSMVPSQRALLGSSPADPFSPVYYPLALISKGWLSPSPQDTDRVFSAMITNVTSGRLAPRDALSTAAQALDAALAH